MSESHAGTSPNTFKVEVAIVLNVGLDYVIKAGYYSGAVANNQ